MKLLSTFAAAFAVVAAHSLARAAPALEELPPQLAQRLKEPNPVDNRHHIEASGRNAAEPPQQQEMIQDFQQLIKSLQMLRAQRPLGVHVLPGEGQDLRLRYDLRLLPTDLAGHRISPFGTDVLEQPIATNTQSFIAAAQTEYRNEVTLNGAQRIVAIRQGSDIAAAVLEVADKPVSVSVTLANLAAHQVVDGTEHPPVDVQVGQERSRLREGEEHVFGTISVLVQVSGDFSRRQNLEGPPYALRLIVQPAR